MTNPILGELSLTAGGEAYKLVFDVNAFCTLEELLARPAMEAILELQNRPTITLLRAVIWAALQEHHSHLDLKAAGRIIGAAGMANLTGEVLKALGAATPNAKEVAAGGKGPRTRTPKAKPPPTAGGTG